MTSLAAEGIVAVGFVYVVDYSVILHIALGSMTAAPFPGVCSILSLCAGFDF